jgi:hypothetical protein
VGWALKNKIFSAPLKWHQADRRVPFGAKKLTYVFFAELVERLDELLVGVLQDEAHLRLHGGEEQGELLQRAGDNHLIVCQRRSFNIFLPLNNLSQISEMQDKKENQIFLIHKEFRRDQLQSHD